MQAHSHANLNANPLMCLQAVWTLPLTTMCSIICVRVMRAAGRPVWTGPKHCANVWDTFCMQSVVDTDFPHGGSFCGWLRAHQFQSVHQQLGKPHQLGPSANEGWRDDIVHEESAVVGNKYTPANKKHCGKHKRSVDWKYIEEELCSLNGTYCHLNL